MSVDTSQLEQLARDQQQAAQQLQNRINGRITRAMRQLLGVARGDVHVRSGELRDSLSIVAPSLSGEFTTSNIQSRVSYAELEADKGGAHDYAARTIEDGQAIIDGLTADIAELVALAFLGQGSD